LIIVRHARTLTNIRVSEDMDPEITDYGHKQSRNVAKFFKKHMDLSGVSYFTSPFLRCLQTADPIQNLLGVVFTVRPELREYVNHARRDAVVPVRKLDYPDMNWSYFDQYEDGEEITYKDEFNEELLNRIHDLHHSLPEKSLCLTHGLPALTLLHVATKNVNAVPIWDHSLDNASITVIVKGRVVWHGRNLYHELEQDPFDKTRAYDASDLIIPKH